MDLANATVLITGLASGIGLALAERFLKAGSQVIITGRRSDRLTSIQQCHPAIHTRVCDVSLVEERIALRDWATAEFPKLNVLVNNAGVQRHVDLTTAEPWQDTQQELEIILSAPIHLNSLFMGHLLKQPAPAIVNVTSGLSFCPKADVPVYCATKAALHSYTLSLRHQLAAKHPGFKVVEIIPPAVDTDLGGVGLHTFGVPLNEFADAVFGGMAAGEEEVAYGLAAKSSQASRAELDAMFKHLNPSSSTEAHAFLQQQSAAAAGNK